MKRKNPKMRKWHAKTFITGTVCAAVLAGVMIFLSACGPSYPKAELPGAVKRICKEEYNMEVDVTVMGSTMGIYYPMKGLLDVALGVSEEAWDKISNLLLIASRVVLSTDANIKFYCVITQDPRLPELQVVIIKYVDDVKRGMYRNISRNESFKRTLFSINLTPQAKKERSIEKVFERLGVEDVTRESVMEEFFRSTPTRLSDIGYWRENFYLKEVTFSEFLASQFDNRIKIAFRADNDMAELFEYQYSETVFNTSEDKTLISTKFKISDKSTDNPSRSEIKLRERKIAGIINVAKEVFYGYKFEKFDFLVLEDQLENVQMRINRQDIYDFNKKKTDIKDVVHAPAGYFST